tara:strand:- start:1485 stop:1700 length:216 start_codon:yes stop_codon:yes gene_type:complete
MNVRLVAYRKATSGASSTTAYNLDLQEAPSVSLNFQFSDIKEPETRKGSYSQHSSCHLQTTITNSFKIGIM